MSLVSALPERTKTSSRTSTITSDTPASNPTHSMGKIYQTSGEPLSKEALYRAKMKYGYYQSPATNYTIGVSDARSSADAAASLADLTHVTTPTYIRQVDEDAHKAARSIGKRNLAKQHKMSSRTSSITSSSGLGSASAASKAYSMSYVQSPIESPASSSNRTYSISSAASATRKSLSSQSTPPPKHTQSLTNPKPNYSKLINSAEKKAGATIKNRWDPQRKNFQYGIRKSVSNTPEDRKQFEINRGTMSKVMAKQQNSEKRLNAKQKEHENDLRRLQRVHDAKKAAVKVKDTNFSSSIDQEIADKKRERDEYLKQLTSTQVLTLARAKVDQQMNLIETSQAENRIFQNDTYNKAAITLAQSRADSREKTRSNDANKINLGGGLWLSPEDINKISQDLLNPILGEIDTTAKQQRDTDTEIQQRTKKYNEALTSWKSMQRSKDANDIKIIQDMETRHTTEYQEISDKLSSEYTKLKLDLQSQVDAKKKDYDATEQQYEDLKEEFEMKLAMERELAEKEVDSWQKYQDNKINDAELEQKELLKPYNEQLTTSNNHHNELSTEYDDILGNITKLQTVINTHKAKIEEYNDLIKVQESREDREESLLNHLTEDKEALNQTLEEDVMIRAQRVKEQLQLSSKEYEMKQLEIGAMINERQDDLQKIDINLQEERLKLLDAMQKVSKARGDEKLDEEKIKTLFGMTSDEFMKEHKNEPEEAAEEETPEDKGELKEEGEVPEVKETTPNVPSVSVTPAEPQDEADEDEVVNDDTPSFSGFSQGSITNNDEPEQVDRSSPGQSDDTGYFKEVF